MLELILTTQQRPSAFQGIFGLTKGEVRFLEHSIIHMENLNIAVNPDTGEKHILYDYTHAIRRRLQESLGYKRLQSVYNIIDTLRKKEAILDESLHPSLTTQEVKIISS